MAKGLEDTVVRHLSIPISMDMDRNLSQVAGEFGISVSEVLRLIIVSELIKLRLAELDT